MIMKFGKNRLDIDVEKTRQFYQNALTITDDCRCDGCCNFVLGADRLEGDVLSFFSDIGVDIRKTPEITALCAEDDGKSVYYQGFWHICGTLLSESDCWVSVADGKQYAIAEDHLYRISEHASVGFTNRIYLKEADAPEPIVQMEVFIHRVPWVLDKKNPY